jgi:peptide/nickel transport system ATP-binding protein
MSTTSDTPILSVRNLKTYFFQDEGVVKAVDGATFDVYAGQTLGILGESGCGKSVTARSILRIEDRPARVVDGEILLRSGTANGEVIDLAQLHPEGQEIRSIRGVEISLVFQEPMTSFSAHYTVGNQIIESIRLHQQVNKREARNLTIELMRKVGVPKPERRVDEYSFQLSGGLRQRVMIAMALANNPRILIADEPTTALDVTTQAHILDLLQQLQEQFGMAIILITHNVGVIAEIADQVAVMYLGRVVEYGPVNEIFHNPKHPYTQALLRSIPSILAKPRSRLPAITGAIPHPHSRPTGCPFHPRCAHYMRGVCERHEPVLLPVPDSDNIHNVSCFLYHPVGEEAPVSAGI